MKNEVVFLLAKSDRPDAWDQEEKASYDAAVLDTEFRNRLYSEKGLELLDSLERQPAPLACARSH
jgi:hypothetical protein